MRWAILFVPLWACTSCWVHGHNDQYIRQRKIAREYSRSINSNHKLAMRRESLTKEEERRGATFATQILVRWPGRVCDLSMSFILPGGVCNCE